MLYLLNEHEIRDLYKHKLKPAHVMRFDNWSIFPYTGADIVGQSGRQCTEDQFTSIADDVSEQSQICECLCDAIASNVVVNKLTDPDK